MDLEGLSLGIRAFRSYQVEKPQTLSSTPIEKLIELANQLNTIQEQLKVERDGLVSQSGSNDPGNYINVKLRQVIDTLDAIIKEANAVDKAINDVLDKPGPNSEAAPDSQVSIAGFFDNKKYPGAHVISSSNEKAPNPTLASMYPNTDQGRKTIKTIKTIKTREPIKGCTGIEAFEEYQSIKPKPRDPSEKLHTAIDWLERNADLLEEELADMAKRGYHDTPIYKATLDTLNEVVKEKIQLEEYADTVVTGPVDDENLARILQEEFNRESAPISSKSAHPTYPGILPEADHDGLVRIHPAEHDGNAALRQTEPRKVDLRPVIAAHTPLYSDMEMAYHIVVGHNGTGLSRYIDNRSQWTPVHQPVPVKGRGTLNIIPYLNIMALVGEDINSMLIHSSEHDIVVGLRVAAGKKSPGFNHEEIVKDTILISEKYAELVRRDSHEGVKQIELRRVNGITLKLDTYATLRLSRLKPHHDGRRPRVIITTLSGVTGVVPDVHI